MSRPEIYVSVDCEADGPIIRINSLRSIGAAAYDEDGILIDTFSENLFPLPHACENETTMDFFRKNPAAWQALLVSPDYPERVMERFYWWLKDLPGKVVFCGYPVVYDHPWIHQYFLLYGFDNPFSHSGIDIKTTVFDLLDCKYRDIGKSDFPEEWFDPELVHTHIALDDALEQGHIFFAIRAELKKMRWKASEYDRIMQQIDDNREFIGYSIGRYDS